MSRNLSWLWVLLLALIGCNPQPPVSDFDFSPSTTSLSANPGQTLSLNITLERKNGFAEPVEVSLQAPDGSGVQVAAKTILSSQNSTTLDIAVANTAALQKGLQLSLKATAGSKQKTKQIFLDIVAPPAFNFTLEPSSKQLSQGQSFPLKIQVERETGFLAGLSVNVTPPDGSGLLAQQASLGSGSNSITLDIAVPLSAPLNSNLQVPVKLSGGGVERTQILTLGITEANWFAPTTSSLSILKGQQAGLTINLDRSLVSGEVVVGLAGTPPAGLLVSPLTIPANSNTGNLLFNAGTNMAVGTYPLILEAKAGDQTKTKTLNLTVSEAPSFDLQLSSAAPTLTRGQSTTLTVTLAPLNGFVGLVDLSLLDAPLGLSASFNPSSLNGAISAPLPPQSILTLSADSSLSAGTYTLKVRGTSGAQVVDKTLTLTVSDPPDFQIQSVQPPTLELIQGGSANLTISINRTNLSDAINLSLQGLPNGVGPQTATIPANQTSTTLTLNASETATPGTVNLTLSAVAGSITRTSPLSLGVKVPFELSLSKSSSNITIGSSDTLNITLTRNLNFAGTISLSLQNTPTGLNPSFNPTSLSQPQTQSVLTLNSSNSLVAGSYALKVRASSGNFVLEQNLSLSASQPSPPPTGKIWVLDKGNNRILGYSAADPAGSTPINLNLSAHASFGLQGLSMDAAGNLWFSRSSSANGQQGQVLRIPVGSIGSSGNPTPDITVTGSDFFYPSGIAFDASGTLWVANGGGFLTGFKSNRLSSNYSGNSDINISRAVFANGATNLMFDSNQNMWVAASSGDRDTDDDQRFNPLGKKCSDRTGALVKFKPNGPSGYDSSGFPWPAMVVGDESATESTPNNIYAGGYPCLGMNYDGRNVRDTSGVAIDSNGGIWAANSGLHPDQNQYYLSRFNLSAIEQNNCTHRDQNNQPAGTSCYFPDGSNKIACPEASSYPVGEQGKYITPNGEWKCAATARIFLSEKPWGMTSDSQGNLWVTTATKLLKFSAASLPTTGDSSLAPSVSISGLSNPQGIYYR